jgi:hypothetical protein
MTKRPSASAREAGYSDEDEETNWSPCRNRRADDYLFRPDACIDGGPVETHTAIAQDMMSGRLLRGVKVINGGLALSPGFFASIFADNLGHVRHLVVAPRKIGRDSTPLSRARHCQPRSCCGSHPAPTTDGLNATMINSRKSSFSPPEYGGDRVGSVRSAKSPWPLFLATGRPMI